jgi:hypothetical protein
MSVVRCTPALAGMSRLFPDLWRHARARWAERWPAASRGRAAWKLRRGVRGAGGLRWARAGPGLGRAALGLGEWRQAREPAGTSRGGASGWRAAVAGKASGSTLVCWMGASRWQLDAWGGLDQSGRGGVGARASGRGAGAAWAEVVLGGELGRRAWWPGGVLRASWAEVGRARPGRTGPGEERQAVGVGGRAGWGGMRGEVERAVRARRGWGGAGRGGVGASWGDAERQLAEQGVGIDAGQRPALAGGPALAGLRIGFSRFALFREISARTIRRVWRKLEWKIDDSERNKRNWG